MLFQPKASQGCSYRSEIWQALGKRHRDAWGAISKLFQAAQPRRQPSNVSDQEVIRVLDGDPGRFAMGKINTRAGRRGRGTVS